MQFIPAPIQLPFEVTYDSPSLYVGLVAFDVTDPMSPIQVSKVAMNNLIGNTYFGVFTPTINKTYVISKAVYTDNSLTTIDTNYSEASESIACGAVKLAPDQIQIKKGVALNNFSFTMLGADTQEPIEYLTVTAKISKDGAPFVTSTNLVSEIGSGWYKIDLTADEMNADTIAVNFSALGADVTPATIITQE